MNRVRQTTGIALAMVEMRPAASTPEAFGHLIGRDVATWSRDAALGNIKGG